MGKTLTATEIEDEAKKAGLTVAQLCAGAKIAHSTFTRWRAGQTHPSTLVYDRMVDAIEAARVAEPASPPAA